MQELSRMEAIKEQKVQEDQSDTSMVTEKESMCDIIIVHCYTKYNLSFEPSYSLFWNVYSIHLFKT